MITEGLNPYLENIDDPRSMRNQKHLFKTLIGTTLLSYMSGIESFSGIAEFVEAHLEALENYFEFPYGVPSHDTYQRLWDAIDPLQFYKAFEAFTKILVDMKEGLISIDGKTIRNSGSDKPLHIVSAWCASHQLTLAQEKVDVKSNEIKAIPNLLTLLDLTNRIITIDAMGTQRNICKQIIEQEGDYVIAIKGNQGALFEDVKACFQDDTSLDCFEENDKAHGRIESRVAYVTDDIQYLKDTHKWPGLRSIGMVASKTIRKQKESFETRFYISSLEANAEILNKTARSHWGIENKLHWRLDVVFNEDKACVRNDNAAENMNILRKWSLNILQKVKDKPDRSIKSLMRKNAMSFKHLLSCVKRIFHA